MIKRLREDTAKHCTLSGEELGTGTNKTEYVIFEALTHCGKIQSLNADNFSRENTY